MAQQNLALTNHSATLYEDGTLTIVSSAGIASVLLTSNDTATLLTWLCSHATLPPMMDGPEPNTVHVLRLNSSVQTKIDGYEGWTYQNYQIAKRYHDIGLFYHGRLITFLKQWSKHYAEDDNPHRHYASLEAAIAAYQDSWRVKRIDEERQRLQAALAV